MRKITDHRIDEGGFSETIRGFVRNSPWWLTSAVVHLCVLFVLAQFGVPIRATSNVTLFEASRPDEVTEPEPPLETPPPEPEPPPEAVVEEFVPEDDDQVPQEDPLDDIEIDPAPDPGDEELPFTGFQKNSAIGLLGGAGGPRGGKGGRRRKSGAKGAVNTLPIVMSGLKWLADHQDVEEDGRWDCDDFMKHDDPDDRCDGPGHALYDVGVTGLAVLAFLGAGFTDRGSEADNPFARHVQKGLRYLMTVQDEEGCFGTRTSQHFMYNTAIATLAMSEAYWMTRNPRYKKPAQEGLNFISRARNPYLAWRYEPRGGENDTSVTGWMVMALKSGKFGGLDIDPDAFEGARQWIEKMTDPEFGQVGYQLPGGSCARPEGLMDRFPPDKSQSMTAVGMLTRIFLGEDPRRSEIILKGADLCLEHPPTWNPDDGSIDMYYWYYATLAMFQVGGDHWRKWNKAMVNAIVKSQHPRNSGNRSGSWDPIGPWGGDGGRVYATAAMITCLEVYYRYDRVFPYSASMKIR
ncbi:MAG: prenyltransferase/squalene oxidase repeat-containing protein [Planctomycetota bacterium]|jgi:hypothetical protein